MNGMIETILDVHGMTCVSCVRHVEEALFALAGIETVEVKLATGKVRVKHGSGTTSDRMIAALGEVGYGARVS